MNQPGQINPVASLIVVDDTPTRLLFLTDLPGKHNNNVRTVINVNLTPWAVAQGPYLTGLGIVHAQKEVSKKHGKKL